MTLAAGSVLETADDSYTVVGPAGVGGFGIVYRVTRDGDGEQFAAKIMQDPDTKGYSKKRVKEIQKKAVARFDRERAMLDELGDIEIAQEMAQDAGYYARSPQPFPLYYGSGSHRGIPFYIMEWLEPVDLKTLDTDEKRQHYLLEVCDAVGLLHGEGYVHYDLKPSNIMRRNLAEGENGYEYVLTDFGSVHKAEEHDCSQGKSENTVSWLSNGARLCATTRGYADPMDDLHTIHADIYALGQIARDLFDAEVPFAWSPIINKCTSRYYGHRYASVEELRNDIEKLERFRRKVYWQLRKERIQEQRDTERSLVRAREKKVTLAEIRREDLEYPVKGMKFIRIGLTRDPRCHFKLKEPIVLEENTVLFVSGRGILDADISGPSSSAVVVRAYAALNNLTTKPPPENDLTYVIVGPGSYLNFPNVTSNEYRRFFPGRRRILRDLDATTSFRFGGPKSFAGVENDALKAINDSSLPKNYKRVLTKFFKGENFTVEPERQK